jgi:hypothetical protein
MYQQKYKYGTPGDWAYYLFVNFLPYILIVGLALWLRYLGYHYWWAALFIVVVVTRDWAPAPWKIRQW